MLTHPPESPTSGSGRNHIFIGDHTTGMWKIWMGDGIGMWKTRYLTLVRPMEIKSLLSALQPLQGYINNFYCMLLPSCLQSSMIGCNQMSQTLFNQWPKLAGFFIILHMASHQVGSLQHCHSERRWKMIAMSVWFSRVETSCKSWWRLHCTLVIWYSYGKLPTYRWQKWRFTDLPNKSADQ